MKINFYKEFKKQMFLKFQTLVYIFYKVLTKHTKKQKQKKNKPIPSKTSIKRKEQKKKKKKEGTNSYHCPLVLIHLS